MKFLMVLLLAVLTSHLYAAEIKLATITTDVDTDTTIFFLETNESGEAIGMRYLTFTTSGQISEDMNFSVEEVLNGGVVVEERLGHEAVRLFVENFNTQSGGTIRLNYLVNGATQRRANFRMTLSFEEDHWVVRDLSSNRVNQLFFKGNWVRVLGLVGIREIRPSYSLE